MSTTTNYIWDEENLVAETDGSNVVQTVYTNEPQHYGNLISARLGSSSFYYHFDALGSTRQLTNNAGTVTDTVIYDAWGIIVTRTGSTGVFALWLGQLLYYRDAEISLFAIGERTYGSLIARWTARDPAGFRDGHNVFAYVLNSPINSVDPSGRAVLKKSPEAAKDADWCSVKQPIRSKRDPRGKGTYGVTATFAYDVQCVCVCCDEETKRDGKKQARLCCTLRAWLQIQIHEPFAKNAPSPEKGVPAGVEGVYGHEQLHVANLLAGAEKARAKAEEIEKNRGCRQELACTAQGGIAEQVTNEIKAILDEVDSQEIGHKSAKPVEGRNYSPMNALPKSKCDKPGAEPDFPKGRACS